MDAAPRPLQMSLLSIFAAAGDDVAAGYEMARGGMVPGGRRRRLEFLLAKGDIWDAQKDMLVTPGRSGALALFAIVRPDRDRHAAAVGPGPRTTDVQAPAHADAPPAHAAPRKRETPPSRPKCDALNTTQTTRSARSPPAGPARHGADRLVSARSAPAISNR